MTPIRQVQVAAALLLAAANPAAAAGVPGWAVGTWQATSMAAGPDLLGWGKSGAASISAMLAATRVSFTRSSFNGARVALVTEVGSGGTALFIGGARGITAREGSAPLRTLLSVTGAPVVFGQSIAINPDAAVPFARLTLPRCIDLGPTPTSRDEAGRLLPGTERSNCPALTIYRFPDSHHIALPGLLGGWVIYEQAAGSAAAPSP